MSLIAMGVAGALGGSSTAAAAVVGGHDQAGGRAMIRIAAMRLLSVRGGARVDVTRRKKKHLGLKVMIKSFVKSMFDPAFGRDDLAGTCSDTMCTSVYVSRCVYVYICIALPSSPHPRHTLTLPHAHEHTTHTPHTHTLHTQTHHAYAHTPLPHTNTYTHKHKHNYHALVLRRDASKYQE